MLKMNKHLSQSQENITNYAYMERNCHSFVVHYKPDLLYAIMHGETICCIPLKLRIADNRIVKLKIDLFEFISQF